MRNIPRRRLLGAATAVAAALGLAVVVVSPAWAVAPANDNFANAQGHSASFTDSLSTVDATMETNESDPCYEVTNSVWYGLTISAGTEVSVDTIGSDFDTTLVVFTGSSVDSLTLIECDDDEGPGVTSFLEFTASSSTTYWIQAAGLSGDYGDLELNVVVTPPPGADVSVSVADSADPVSLGAGTSPTR